MMPKLLLIFPLLFVAIGCQPKPTGHSGVTSRPAPHLVTIATVKRENVGRATRALGRRNITFSLDTDNNPKVHIMVDPADESAAIDALAEDAKAAKSKGN